MSKKYADFSQLSKLANKLDTAVRFAQYDNSVYSNQKILKAGAYKQMEHLLKETPMGENGSNWYDWYYPPGGGDLGGEHSASYYLKGRTHSGSTLVRGWVSDMPEGGANRRPGRDVGHRKVDMTPIDHHSDGISMTFWNTTPYAWAVERGHLVRMPYFFDGSKPRQGRITGFVPGQWYTMRAVFHAEDDVRKAIAKETVKQLRNVVRIK